MGRPDFLVAHTHYERGDPDHEAAQKRVRRRYPKPKTHAGEGADAAARILYEALDGKRRPELYRAAFTAIARHHSPFLQEANPYRLHAKAQDTLAAALVGVGEESWRTWAHWLRDSPNEAPKIQHRLVPPYNEAPLAWWLYFLIVRNLRLCDGLSQER